MDQKVIKVKYNRGRWTIAQNSRFMKAIEKYGKNWIQVQKKVKSRSISQIRSHAQKVFLNIPDYDIQALFSLPVQQQEISNIRKSGNGSSKKKSKNTSVKSKTDSQQKEIKQEYRQKDYQENQLNNEKQIKKQQYDNFTHHQIKNQFHDKPFPNQFMYPPHYWYPHASMMNLGNYSPRYPNVGEYFGFQNRQFRHPPYYYNQNIQYQNNLSNKKQNF